MTTAGPRGRAWPTWLLAAALLSAVVLAAFQFSDARDFARLAERADPRWFAGALLLQGLTYLLQAGVLRIAPARAGRRLPWRWFFELSFAKLFVDQALPSAGVGSLALVARALEARGVHRSAAAAGAILNLASYHIAYALLLAAVLPAVATRPGAWAIVPVSLLFLAFAVAMVVSSLALAGRHGPLADALARVKVAARASAFLEGADARLARGAAPLGQAVAWQAGIFIADAATMWTLVRSLGDAVSPAAVFSAFMVASVVRTMGIVPGGLGPFEAASVVMLRTTGLDVPTSLAATLLFRGLSFWLPMLPGFWCSRRVMREAEGPVGGAGAKAHWADDSAAVLARLGSGPTGLDEAEARRRFETAPPLTIRRGSNWITSAANQLRSPLLLLLLFASAASALTGEWIDASIVMTVVVATIAVTSSREHGAHRALAALQATIHTRARVVRGGRTVPVPLEEVVAGDIVLLSAGSLVPGDGLILEAADFFVSEAALTGESFPVEKSAGIVPAAAAVPDRTNCVFLGTNVRSGTARAVIVRTGADTEFGAVAGRLAVRAPETEFDRGLRRFGGLLTTSMLVLVIVVFAAHVVRGRPPIEVLLFAVALAVGLSPELLPAVLSVNLARGAQVMARSGVIVRRLNAIENLGSMDVLCTDKTGTITEGVVQLDGAFDARGQPSAAVLSLGALNAALETGIGSPLDDAILAAHQPAMEGVAKAGEIPFDFARKRVSVIVDGPEGRRLIAKGAVNQVIDVCDHTSDGGPLDDDGRDALRALADTWTAQGTRVLAVADKPLAAGELPDRTREQGLRFAGFLTFLDRPKAGAAEAIAELNALGVAVKVVSGDSRRVVQHVAGLVGLRADAVLAGPELRDLTDEALAHEVDRVDLFAEIDPNQKERIILALKRRGHAVGFLGDGVNDAPAMHAADTSISVEHAVDVAREAADFVLLRQSLGVIKDGIAEGRRTFANTLKYILTTTSANLGNMLSMALASLVLPFLPLLPGQILLNNFLSDIPAVGIADDSVDPEMVARPDRWSMRFIGRFMVEFGILSSVFDGLTFLALLSVFQASPELFRTAWFVESLLTELAIALVVRTRRPFYRSRPGTLLLVSTVVLVVAALLVPLVPGAGLLGFVPLPPPLVAAIIAITVAYVAAAEMAKRWFYRAQ